jgi:hypothetical protein
VVFAAVHFDEATRIGQLEAELLAIRQALGLPSGFVFKHDSASPRVKQHIFAALARLQFSGHVLCLDKQAWRAANPGARGDDLLQNGVVALVAACPDCVVARNVLLIDPPSARFIKNCKTPINRAFRAQLRTGYRSIRGLQDTHHEGGIIQVADMVAGEVRLCGGIAGPYLPGLGDKVSLI